MPEQPNLFENEYKDDPGLTYWENKCVAQLRQEILDKREEGCLCKICDQYVKLYKVKLNSGMAHFLCWMFTQPNHAFAWIDVPLQAPRQIIKNRNYGRLAHWGLIEAKQNDDDPTKKDSGLWRLTQKGLAFVTGNLTVPKHVMLYNNIAEGFSEEHTKIKDCFESHFNYEELMRGEL